MSLVYLHMRHGASLRPLSVLRATGATLLAVAAGRALPLAGKAQLAACVIGGLVYLAALALLGELTPRELRALLKRG